MATNRLRELREARGLTQTSLALLVGVAERTYRSWEAGTNVPTARNARRLARRLGVTVEALGLGKPSQ